MKIKRKTVIIIISAIVVLALAAAALIYFFTTREKGVDILKQPDDYVGEFYVPSSNKVEDGSALSVLANINEDVFEVNEAIKTQSDDPTVVESYKINCYGVNIELFKYTDESPRLAEVRETGKFIVRSSDDSVLAEFTAVANGHYVIMFSSSLNGNAEDCSEQNQKIIDKFKSLTLE